MRANNKCNLNIIWILIYLQDDGTKEQIGKARETVLKIKKS